MTNIEFANKAKEIAKMPTLYVNGSWGQQLTDANKKKFMINTEYNRRAERQAKIRQAKSTTRGFDCVCLIKSILWGFPNTKYASNGVPDIGEDVLIKQCSPSTNFKADIPIGAVLHLQGHIGIYIGNSLCVEATPAWKDGVQITNVGNITGYSKTYPTRVWKQWGKLPFLEYVEEEVVVKKKVLCGDKELEINAIVSNGENYIRMRDFDDVLGIAEVDYDSKKKLPIINKK